MKTIACHVFKGVFRAACLVALVLMVSCRGKEGATGQEADTAQQQAGAPAVDLHTAVITDNVEAVKQHIAAGTDLNIRDPFGGSSPLISAAVFGKPVIARALIDAGADVNFQNNDGSTALHTAAFFCRPAIVRMLLDKNADKTIKNKFGATPYQTVAIPFEDAKPGYDMMGKMLAPMGLTLDYAYLQKTRPEIAAMLK